MKHRILTFIVILLLLNLCTLLSSCKNDDFKDAYAIVYIGKTPYLYNAKGEMKSLEKYETISTVFDDLMVISRYINQKSKYGYINRDGEEVIKPQYDIAYPFSEGKAVVKKGDEYKIINEKNKVLYTLPNGISSYAMFAEGFLKIETENGFSFINSDYQKCPYDFYQVRDYSEGKALVTKKENGTTSFAYLDEDFNILLENELRNINYADSFYDGLAIVRDKDTNLYSYIHHDGSFLYDENGNYEFKDARNFKNGRAVVFTGQPYYVFNSMTGVKIADYYSYQYLNQNGTYFDYNYRSFHHEDPTNVLLWGYLGNWCGDIVLTKLFTTGAGKWLLYQDSVYEKTSNDVVIYYYDGANTYDDAIIPTGLERDAHHGIDEINVSTIDEENVIQLVLTNGRRTTFKVNKGLTIKAMHYELSSDPEIYHLTITLSDNSQIKNVKICNHYLKEIPFTSNFTDLSRLEQEYYTMPYDIAVLKTSKFYTNEEVVLMAVRVSTDKVAIVNQNGEYITKSLFDNVIF